MKALWKYYDVRPSDHGGWATPGLWALVLASFMVLMLIPVTASCSVAEDLTVSPIPTDVGAATPASTEPPTTSLPQVAATVTETTAAPPTTTTTETAETTVTTAAPETTLAPETTVTTAAPATTLASETSTTEATEFASVTTATEGATTTVSESTTTTEVESTTTTVSESTTTTAVGEEPPPSAPPTTVPPVGADEQPGQNVLYEISEWSAEGTSGWAAAGQWKTVDGMLVTDGSSDSFAVAPVDLTDYPDYVIECEVQIIDPEKTDIFLLARMINGRGYRGGFDASGSRLRIGFDNEKIRSVPFVLDDKWHTYRLEVRGNAIKLFFEQAEVARAIDNRAVEPGTVGIYCENGQINVRSFRVIAL